MKITKSELRSLIKEELLKEKITIAEDAVIYGLIEKLLEKVDEKIIVRELVKISSLDIKYGNIIPNSINNKYSSKEYGVYALLDKAVDEEESGVFLDFIVQEIVRKNGYDLAVYFIKMVMDDNEIKY